MRVISSIIAGAIRIVEKRFICLLTPLLFAMERNVAQSIDFKCEERSGS